MKDAKFMFELTTELNHCDMTHPYSLAAKKIKCRGCGEDCAYDESMGVDLIGLCIPCIQQGRHVVADGAVVDSRGKQLVSANGSVAKRECAQCGRSYEPRWLDKLNKWSSVCASCAWRNLEAFLAEPDPKEEKPPNDRAAVHMSAWLGCFRVPAARSRSREDTATISMRLSASGVADTQEHISEEATP